MKRSFRVLLLLSIALNLAAIYHLRFELYDNLKLLRSRPATLIADSLKLYSAHEPIPALDADNPSSVAIPSQAWPDSIRTLNPSRVWWSLNEGLMIQTIGSGISRDGGYAVTRERRPAHAQLYFYDTWYPNLYRWETVINE